MFGQSSIELSVGGCDKVYVGAKGVEARPNGLGGIGLDLHAPGDVCGHTHSHAAENRIRSDPVEHS
ncbi:hypothetical protein GCM10007913_39810 [Devosia yakushimensis]|uniref:Uncharacterized protein n=1 Tax=Devosia yakushimensis TaxID=470028 RepID=A0ABQ5UIX8_9HYPH|nr:hypothetical protein GCM10007913_39810 [Devosia yakushimensis]